MILNTSITDFFENNSIELPFSYQNVFCQMASGVENGLIVPSLEIGTDNSITLNFTAQSSYLKEGDSELYFVVRVREKITLDPTMYQNFINAMSNAMWLVPLALFAAFAAPVVSFSLPNIWYPKVVSSIAAQATS